MEKKLDIFGVLVLSITSALGGGVIRDLLLGGEEADWTIKKGALWWFSNRVRGDETQTVLRTVISPDLL